MFLTPFITSFRNKDRRMACKLFSYPQNQNSSTTTPHSAVRIIRQAG